MAAARRPARAGAETLRLLGPRFRGGNEEEGGGNERDVNSSILPAEYPLRRGPPGQALKHRGSWAPAFVGRAKKRARETKGAGTRTASSRNTRGAEGRLGRRRSTTDTVPPLR